KGPKLQSGVSGRKRTTGAYLVGLGVITRIRPQRSVKKTLPLLSTAIPVGAFTRAAVAALPSPPKVDPPPAMMDICPAGVMIRIRLLLVSATYVFKAASIAQPWGPFPRDCQPLAGRASEPPSPMIPPMVMMM